MSLNEELAEIQERYRQFDDHKIEQLALGNVSGLRAEVLPFLIREIEERGLRQSLIDRIRAERRTLTTEEWQGLIKKVENGACGRCRRRNQQLKGFNYTYITGLLLMTSYTPCKVMLCEACGRKGLRNSIIWTFFLGWWSAKGLFSTPFVLLENIMSYVKREAVSQKVMNEFIVERIGMITLGEDRQEVIDQLLDEFNGIEEE